MEINKSPIWNSVCSKIWITTSGDHVVNNFVSTSKLQPIWCNISWFIYFYIRSTCFRRFLRPSSGAYNCTRSFRYCQTILLPLVVVDETAVLVDNTRSCVYSYVLLMMGRGTAWNKKSACRNKWIEKRCILLVVIWNYTSIYDARTYEYQKWISNFLCYTSQI